MKETDRRSSREVSITPEMIEAGAAQVIVNEGTDDGEIARDVLVAALEAGGYCIKEVGEAA